MRVTTVDDFTENMEQFMDATLDNSDYLIVARPGGKNIVMMSEQAFNSWKETTYLLSSPANAAQLEASEKSIQKGELAYRGLKESRD